MLLYCHPPAQQATATLPELPLLPGSDHMLLGAYQWAVVHSPSLQTVVRQLATTDKKARYKLVPSFESRYGFTVFSTEEGYEVNVEVPVLGWSQCGDALEPWIASALFLALEVVDKEKYRAKATADELSFLPRSIAASFTFQDQVRKELVAADPKRLEDLPDGAQIYRYGFAYRRNVFKEVRDPRRALPPGVPSSIPVPPERREQNPTPMVQEDRTGPLPPAPLKAEPPSPAPTAAPLATELPLLPGSDPMLLGAYQWAVVHSPSLQEVVRQLATTDKKARYRLVPCLEVKFSLTIFPTKDAYEINVEVPVLAWSQCGDALEPWIASALFLTLEAISKEKYREQKDSKSYALLRESVLASFAFQNQVRKELLTADPERLRDLPDGRTLYESRFRPRAPASPTERPLRRALPP